MNLGKGKRGQKRGQPPFNQEICVIIFVYATYLSHSSWRRSLFDKSPTDLPLQYSSWINYFEDTKIVQSIRDSVIKGSPYGRDIWVEKMVITHNLQPTLRSPGRPRKI